MIYLGGGVGCNRNIQASSNFIFCTAFHSSEILQSWRFFFWGVYSSMLLSCFFNFLLDPVIWSFSKISLQVNLFPLFSCLSTLLGEEKESKVCFQFLYYDIGNLLISTAFIFIKIANTKTRCSQFIPSTKVKWKVKF